MRQGYGEHAPHLYERGKGLLLPVVQLKEGSITLQKEALLLTETGTFSLTEEETEMARVLLEYGQEHTFIVEETPIAIRRGVLGVQAAGDGFTVQLTFQKKSGICHAYRNAVPETGSTMR